MVASGATGGAALLHAALDVRGRLPVGHRHEHGRLRDHHVGSFHRLMAHYESVGWLEWRLRGLSATEDPRCPGGRAAVLALDAEALTERLAEDIREGRAEEGLRRWRCAFAYQARAHLPDAPARERLADEAQARGAALEREGKLLPALRHHSLATLLDGGNAHRRRKTEALRGTVFPRVIGSPRKEHRRGRR